MICSEYSLLLLLNQFFMLSLLELMLSVDTDSKLKSRWKTLRSVQIRKDSHSKINLQLIIFSVITIFFSIENMHYCDAIIAAFAVKNRMKRNWKQKQNEFRFDSVVFYMTSEDCQTIVARNEQTK